ncbi:ABC transporter ATP-binding protein [Selenomonas sputigena]|uniref:ABC transporter, ATP-binding protein n=1 Tax=Selenomonas sputigena (strain ATCC 35185 / DSM 20758 / CCUG 44933 / VPI D19B-28) TaxID=546271 RepID=C9LUI5_SELS3|nr:ABC transporter ATP-binding protein [Selenomonas sputigena]AEC00083.1 Nickel-transporting ATPase [Selenomonas sputigena ATCC 35185]EEX77418.1 ABC transporter, ATP-binding protein [Selenomonas sputigena ATCC 35185]
MLLEVKNLHIQYAGTEMVHGISFSLDSGEVLSLVGESGSGKTSVIRAILGCLPHEGRVNEGEIIFSGVNMLENTPKMWRDISGRNISMIFQDSGSMMNPIRTIGSQFVEYILEHSSMDPQKAEKEAKEMLDKMQLPNPDTIMDSFPFELSGGMRQRVGVAMAMFFRPQLLLADEPTSALDVTTQAQVVKELMKICREDGTAIILVTHNLGVATYMSDKIMVMQNGHVVEEGTSEAIIENPQANYTKELLHSVPQIGGMSYAS